MSSEPGDSGKRRIYLPPPDLARLRLPVTPLDKEHWWRVHPGSRSPVAFGRRAAHRFSPLGASAGVLYLAEDIETCLFERFGDQLFGGSRILRRDVWEAASITRLRLPSVSICDLTRSDVRSQMNVDLASLMAADLSVPQAWALAIMKHPSGFQGIRYNSRFTNRRCLAMFDSEYVAGAIEQSGTSLLVESKKGAAFLEEQKVALV